MELRLPFKEVFALALVVILGGVLRIWGISFGLPYTVIADEPIYLSIALRMFQSGDLNPHWWYYPTLMFYLQAIALAFYFLAGHAAGLFASPGDLVFPEIVTMGVGQIMQPNEFLVARGVTAFFGIAGIGMVYLIARQFHSEKFVALLAALLFAISPTIVAYSQRIGPDVIALFFVMLSFLFASRIVDVPRVRNYVWAGIGVGLATASKYNAGLILVALLTAHFLRFGLAGWRRKELGIAFLVAGLAFIVASPYALLDFPHFWEGVRFQLHSYAVEGHIGEEGNALQWYISYLWQSEGLAILLGGICSIYFLFVRTNKRAVLISFPLVYFLFVSLLHTRNARTIMLILPFLFILAATLFVDIYQSLMINRRVQIQSWLGALVFALALITPPLQTTILANIRLLQTDARDTARAWIETNLLPGTRIILESYAPYIDTSRFTVQGVSSILDYPPEWYAHNGFEYLVLSQGMYGRFFNEPDRYADWIRKYNHYFNYFKEVKRFNIRGYEVRIYQTVAELPVHRVAARFGDYGDHIELIGYDDVRWIQGDPLRVRLFWRVLGDRPEPYEIEMRVLDMYDQEIAIKRDDLFQGKGWRSGMFADTWTILVPTEIVPGTYRLQISVIWTRFAYRMPAKSWIEQNIDPVILGPIEMSSVGK